MNKRFTPQEIQYICTYYYDTPSGTIARTLGRSLRSIYDVAYKYNLRKSPDIIAQMSRNNYFRQPEKYNKTQFKPGHKTWNRGMKGLILSPATQWKKGDKPHNTLHDGAITIRKDKRGNKYKYIRVSEGKWELLQRWIWKQHTGMQDIARDHIVVFKNGDTLDCRLSNLELITLQENMRRNTIHNYPEDIKSTIRIISKINKL